MSRPTPFDLVFAPLAEERFPAIRAALANEERDPRDRDAFLMLRDAVALLHELRPDEGVGEGIDQLAALLHHAYLFWDAGLPVADLAADSAAAVLTAEAPDGTGAPEVGAPEVGEPESGESPAAYYARFPERRVWAVVVPGDPAEPLDGCFVHATPDGGALRVLGVFGLRPDRMGFSVVEAIGPRPAGLRRPDGSPLFAPTLPGGAAARLHSLVGVEELLELGWRTRPFASGAGVVSDGAAPAAPDAEAGRWTA